MDRYNPSMIVSLGVGLLACGLLVGSIPGAALADDVSAAVLSADLSALGRKGPFEIGFTSFVLTDPTRPGDGAGFTNRPIPVYVWYPVGPESITDSTPEAVYPLDPLYETSLVSTSSDWEVYSMDRAYQEPTPSSAGPFPLVVFSPGWGAAAWMHTSIGTRLASHGFVVAVLYHFGDQWWPWEPPYDHIALACWNRPRDMSFALTDLLARNETPGDLLEGLIRPDQVAASGWSLGGYASMVLAGGDDSACDIFQDPSWVDMFGPPPPETCTPSLPDSRFRAIVPLDGSNQVLHFAELTRVTVPAMGMGEEWSMLALDPSFTTWQARQHAAFSSRPAYRVDVFNTNHQSFSDMCAGVQVLGDLGIWSPDQVQSWLDMICVGVTTQTEVQRLIGQYAAAFLKTHLVGIPGYSAMLTPGYAMTREPLIEFFRTEKRSVQSLDEDWPAEFTYFAHQPGTARERGPKDPVAALRIPRMSAAGGDVARAPGNTASRDSGVLEKSSTRPLGFGFTTCPTSVDRPSRVAFAVERPGPVTLKLYDVAGRCIATLASGAFVAGEHSVMLDPAPLANGIYMLRLAGVGSSDIRKLLVLR